MPRSLLVDTRLHERRALFDDSLVQHKTRR